MISNYRTEPLTCEYSSNYKENATISGVFKFPKAITGPLFMYVSSFVSL